MVLTREPNALFRSVSNSTELLRIPVEDEELPSWFLATLRQMVLPYNKKSFKMGSV